MRRLLRREGALDPTWLAAAVRYVRGASWHPPAGAKRRHLRDLLIARNHRVFVESGTYRGDTAAFLASAADRVISVELDPVLCAAARRRFANRPSVEIREGDALDEIPAVVASLKLPALIFLDGHFSGEGTATGAESEPAPSLLRRLAPIAPMGSTIVVDDLRLFGTDYAPLEALMRSAMDSYPGGRLRTGLDCLVIEL